MDYKDLRILTEKEYSNLQQHFDKIKSNQTQDLIEILDNIKLQKNNLLNTHTNSLNKIISKLDENIEILESIVGQNNTEALHLKSSIPNTPSELKQNENTNKPQQFNIFNNLFRNFGFFRPQKIKPSTQNQNYTDCLPYNKYCNNQLNILRLILLYILLRPNCPHIHKITTLALDQLDIYLNIKDNEDLKHCKYSK